MEERRTAAHLIYHILRANHFGLYRITVDSRIPRENASARATHIKMLRPYKT